MDVGRLADRGSNDTVGHFSGESRLIQPVEVTDLVLKIELDQIEGFFDHACTDIVDYFVLEPPVSVLFVLDAVLLFHELLNEL